MQLVKLLHVGTQFSHEELLCHEDQRETVQHACEPHLCFRNLDPGTKKNKDLLEKVQKRVARYVAGDSQKAFSISGMLRVHLTKKGSGERVDSGRSLIKSRIRTLS